MTSYGVALLSTLAVMTECPRQERDWPRKISPSKRRGGRRIQINPPTKPHQGHYPRMQQRAQLRRQVRSPEVEKGKPIIDTPSNERGMPQKQQARPPRSSNCACGRKNQYLRNPKEESNPEQDDTSFLSEVENPTKKRAVYPAAPSQTEDRGRGQKRIRDR